MRVLVFDVEEVDMRRDRKRIEGIVNKRLEEESHGSPPITVQFVKRYDRVVKIYILLGDRINMVSDLRFTILPITEERELNAELAVFSARNRYLHHFRPYEDYVSIIHSAMYERTKG